MVVNSANRWTNRPGGIIAAYPREQFPVTGYKRGTVWSKFHVQLPHGHKASRINVHRYWRAELDQLAMTYPAQPGVAVAAGVPDELAGPEAVAS